MYEVELFYMSLKQIAQSKKSSAHQLNCCNINSETNLHVVSQEGKAKS